MTQRAHTKKPPRLGWIAIGVAAVAGMFGFAGFEVAQHTGPSVSSNGNEVGGTFRLMDLGGEGTVTEGDLRGRWLLMWFADASCPTERCAPVYRAMSDAAGKFHGQAHVAPVVVTLNPMEDDSNARRDAILKYGSRLIVLTGSPAEVYAVAQEFHAGVHKIPLGQNSFRMGPEPDRIVIMDPGGAYAGTIDTTATSDQIVARLEALSKSQ